MKKIMILMLSLAVLFSFAACDNSTSGSTPIEDQYVISIEVTDGPEAYFAGQKVDLADYTVTATQNNGATFVVPAKDLSFSDPDGLSANEGSSDKTIGTITYNGIFVATNVKPTVKVEADVYTVDAIAVAVVADQQTYYATNSSLKNLKDDYTVTAYAFDDTVADPSTKTAEDALYYAVIDSSDITLNDGTNDLTADSTFDAAELVTLEFKLFGTEVSKSIKDGKATAQLVVQADYVSDFSVAVVTPETATGTVAYPVIGGTIEKTDVKNYLVITEAYASGITKKQVGNAITASYTVAWDANISDTKFVENKGYTLTVKGKAGAAQADTTKTLEVTPVKNEVVSFTISGGPTTIKSGDKINAEDYTVAAVWLDDDADGVTTDLTLLIDGNATYTVPDNYPADTDLLVKLTLQEYPNATTISTIATKTGA